ncbi:MAG: hypothetical protein HYT96_01070 [Armatimonadetes bacterium]|nr:hypothetical protein [Armatimonadota bacterium]MBI2247510.1 hypothetical protein [Armatimonadota bacterium]MBI2973656.1 hypothetical protein [Armatimonadota bacterium]
MKLIAYLAAFAIAIWSLSRGWASLRRTWVAPDAAGMIVTLAYAAVFLGAFLYLGFLSYAADRAAGRVRRRIGLYERFLRT